MRLILLWALLFAASKVAATCAPQWQDKPLLIQLDKALPGEILSISHPELKLLYVLPNNTLIDTPTPSGFADIFRIPEQAQAKPSLVCVYPKYQHKLHITKAQSQLKQQKLVNSDFNQQLAQANLSWSDGKQTSQQQALDIYQDLLGLQPDLNSPQQQALWLTNLQVLQQQFDSKTMYQLLALATDFLLPAQVKIRVLLIEAQLALHNRESELAIHKLQSLLQVDLNKALRLNQEIEAHLLFSNAYFDNYQLEKGAASLEHIGQLLEQEEYEGQVSKHLLANYYDNLGHLHLSRFQSSKLHHNDELYQALEYEYSALAVAKLSGDIGQQISIHNNIAWIYKSAWRFNSAIRNYLIALSLLETINDATNEFYIFRNLGITYLSIGAYEKALVYLLKVQQSADHNTPMWSAKIKCLIGTAQREMGHLQPALNNHQQCVAELKQLAADNNELTNALVEQAKSQQAIETQGNNSTIATLIAQQLPKLNNKDVMVNSLLWLAAYQTDQGQTAALELFEQAVEVSKQAADPILRVNALSQATLAAVRASPLSNDNYIEQAMSQIERVFSELDAGELGPAWSHKIHHFYTSLIEIFVANKQATLAFNLLERSRAASLRLSKPTSSNKLQSGSNISERLTTISQLALTLTAAKAPFDTRLKLEIQRDLLYLHNNMADVNNDQVLAEINWYQSNKDLLQQVANQRLAPATLQQAQAQLQEQQLILAYFETKQDVYAFVVAHNKVHLQKLGPLSQLSAMVDNTLTLITDPDKNPWAALSQLSPIILPQFALTLGKEEWLLLPSTGLSQLPFAALLLSDTSGNSVPLIKQVKLTQLPSLSVFLAGAPVRNYATDFVFFGDPTLPSNELNDANSAELQTWSSTTANLSWTGFEAKMLQQQLSKLNSHFFVQEQASRHNLQQDKVLNAKVLHIATHGYFDKEQPDNVGFALSAVDSAGQNDPGFVTFSELFSYAFHNQLVMINGCETAMGKNLDGSGLQGIARGFMVSGAQNVIATLWPVSDRASAKLIESFYQNLLLSETLTDALRQSQLAMFNNPRFKHPYYWAAYNLYSANANNVVF